MTDKLHWIPITTVRSRAARFCLHFEWIALPMGAGLSVGAVVNLGLIFTGHGVLWAASLAVILLGPAFLTIGLWRPMHRRLGLKRNSWWVAP